MTTKKDPTVRSTRRLAPVRTGAVLGAAALSALLVGTTLTGPAMAGSSDQSNQTAQTSSRQQAMAPTTVTVTGRTMYSGNVSLTAIKDGWAYRLKDPTRGDTEVLDYGRQQADWMSCQIYSYCPRAATPVISYWPSFGSNNGWDIASPAADAMWAAQQSWDFLASRGYPGGWFGTGAGMKIEVNSNRAGSTPYYMEYSKVLSLPWGSPGAYDHRVGLDEVTAALMTPFAARGATTTDDGPYLAGVWRVILGTELEWQLNRPTDVPDYFFGEKSAFGNGSRGRLAFDDSLANGTGVNGCFGQSANGLTNVGLKAYYLMAEGSGAKTINGIAYNSATCDGSTVTGIGRAKTFDLWWTVMNSGTKFGSYSQLRGALIAAAEAKYGVGSVEATQVAAAWSAVLV